METWLFIHADNYDRDKKPQIVPKNMQCKFHQNDQMYLLNWRFLNILVICHRKWRHSTQMLLTSLPPSEMLTQRFSNVIRIRKNYYMIIMLFVFKGRMGGRGGGLRCRCDRCNSWNFETIRHWVNWIKDIKVKLCKPKFISQLIDV